MIKIWFPKSFSESKHDKLYNYQAESFLMVSIFQQLLRSNINKSRLPVAESKLVNCRELEFLGAKKINTNKILNQFVSSLVPKFDINTGTTYYCISPTKRCSGTKNSLDFVIRLIEYGNDKIVPMNWIRHSYLQFKGIVDMVDGEDKR